MKLFSITTNIIINSPARITITVINGHANFQSFIKPYKGPSTPSVLYLSLAAFTLMRCLFGVQYLTSGTVLHLVVALTLYILYGKHFWIHLQNFCPGFDKEKVRTVV
jgi:hypothetical protein